MTLDDLELDGAWNTLPASLQTASLFLTFRYELKTFLFNN